MKKKSGNRQMGFRIPLDLADRLEDCANMLTVDVSTLLRLLIVEFLPAIEERARRARGVQPPGAKDANQ